MRYFFLSLILLLGLGVAGADETSIDNDGMLLVNGDRCFVLGLYQNADTDEFAQEVASAGFNLIRSKADIDELNRAASVGLQCWIPIGNWAIETEDQAQKLKATLETFQSHPALAVWEGPDEILWNVWWNRWNRALRRWNDVNNAINSFQGTDAEKEQLHQWKSKWERYRSSGRYAHAEEVEEKMRSMLGLEKANEKLSEWHTHLPSLLTQLKEGTKIVRECDPHHVIWFNHAPRNRMDQLQQFGKVADIVGCDIYPVPFGPDVGHSDLAEKTIASVGAYTRRMSASAPGKPVWMVLQGFGWDDLRSDQPEEIRARPTYQQTRFMAYDAIVNRARGILYWGTFALAPNSELWESIKKTVSELNRLQRFLSATDVNHKITVQEHPRYGSSEKGIVMLAKESQGDWAFFVVNEADEPIAFDIEDLERLNGRKVEIVNDTETLTVENGSFTYGLPGRSAAVLMIR